MKQSEHRKVYGDSHNGLSHLSLRRNPAHQMQAGQTTVFFTLILTGLLILTAVAIEVGRIVYARGEVGKAADAAALAAAARINVPEYRETGQMVFLPDVYSTAQDMASMNASTLAKRSIPVAVTGITIDQSTQMVRVSVTADFSSLIPGILPFHGQYTMTGYAKARMDR
jgi:Flp pilus assembly protein TadG